MTQFIDRSPAVTGSPATLLKGDWILANAALISSEINAMSKIEKSPLQSEITRLDTAGAWLLADLLQQTGQATEAVTGLKDWQTALLKLIATAQDNKPAPTVLSHQPDNTPSTKFVAAIGEKTLATWQTLLDLLAFIGETVVTLSHVTMQPKRLRMTSLVRHIRETGLAAVPIVSLMAFLISVVLAYQGANQLQRFGAQIFTINMVAISVLREMAVLLTAIMIAGRSGSAFTAEIGMMKVNEEVDAMRIIGVAPFELLVVPRLLALMITLPLLTFVADIMGLIGGGLISETLLGIGFEQYFDRVKTAVQMTDFWVGIIKAPVFAFFIASVGCMRGMQVSGSAESVGRMTTVSVVQSIFLVLLLDAVFSILFTKLGI